MKTHFTIEKGFLAQNHSRKIALISVMSAQAFDIKIHKQKH